jgi:S-formylglutathione hydrolase FrmB
MEDSQDPDCYEREPLHLILLHGLTGTDTDWLYWGEVQKLAVKYNVNVFMPTTGNTFYLDHGYPGGNYCTYIGKELPEYLQDTFGIEMTRENTMIAGLSMGGFGAIHTALQFPETFSACIALSSAMVIHEVAELGKRRNSIMPEAMVRDVFGDPEKLLESDYNPEVLYRKARAADKELPKIYMAIGREDSLYGVNQDFRRFLEAEGADFFYEDGHGMHTWDFWNEYLPRGLEWALKS